ncbi:MAG: type 3 dihydrofolate reductase [Candidatus Aenigmarchaeota archaeon]|nr:type 3 dihydrofolate reductase [Candidatus Aenigmarchaeota archaeon]
MTVISLIAAVSRNRVIGKDYDMPWRLPADWAYFKRKTIGKPCIMGRKTFESLGKPLRDRPNIVITRDVAYKADGCVVVHSLEEALRAAGNAPEIMVIGGADVFRQFLPFASRMYLTFIDEDFQGDTFFPEYNADEWVVAFREDHEPDGKNKYRYSFVLFEKK